MRKMAVECSLIGEVADLEATYLVGKVKAKPHPFVEYFKFLKQF